MTPATANELQQQLDLVHQQLMQIEHMLNMVYVLAWAILILVTIKALMSILSFLPLLTERKQTRKLLRMATIHGEVTDAQRYRTEELLEKATNVLATLDVRSAEVVKTTESLKPAVEEVPNKTANLVVERITPHTEGGSGVNLGR